MEELRKSGKKQFCNRLLKIIAIFFLFCQSAFAITPQEIRSIVIRPEEDVFFTNQEVKFVLEIPGVEPAEVQTQLQTMKDGITFISSRRLEYFTNDESTGTRIEFWFTFRDTGIAEMLPLITRVNGYTYYLEFQKVQVYENPKTIAPRIIIEINGNETFYSTNDSSKKTNYQITSEVTKPIDINLYIQYAVQVKQFGYELPKDSLFQEVERFEMLNGKTRLPDFSHDKVPLINLRWTPLKEGKLTLPNVRLLATAYSGRNVELGLPDCTVNITKLISSEENAGEENSTLFAYALSNPIDDTLEVKEIKATQNDFKKIAELRSKEKHAFHNFFSYRKQRIKLEQNIGIAASMREHSVMLWTIVSAIFILLTAVSIFLFLCKKRASSLIIFCFAFIFAVGAFVLGLLVSEKHGVVTGGTISPVPEDSALSSTAVTAGTCVKIKEQTDNWYFIEYNENGGWIKKEYLILVE